MSNLRARGVGKGYFDGGFVRGGQTDAKNLSGLMKEEWG